MLSAGLNEDAARTAYPASFHMAQAYIFERTGKTSKTRQRVRREFFRLTKDDPRTDPDLRRFLARSYEFKMVADYFSGPTAVVASDEAEEAVSTAQRFVKHFTSLVPVEDPDAGGI